MEAVNMALPALTARQRIVELKLRLQSRIPHIKMELLNGLLVSSAVWQEL